jgi:hypothetical protein
VQEDEYPNRSQLLQRSGGDIECKKTRLARELAALDPAEEKELAEECFGDEPWPPF